MRLQEILKEQDEDYFTMLFQWLSQLNKTDKKKDDESSRLIPVPHEVPNEIKRLMGLVNFTIYGNEHEILSNKMRVARVPATMTNIKRYLIGLMLLPIDEIPEPERTIILRSGKRSGLVSERYAYFGLASFIFVFCSVYRRARAGKNIARVYQAYNNA